MAARLSTLCFLKRKTHLKGRGKAIADKMACDQAALVFFRVLYKMSP